MAPNKTDANDADGLAHLAEVGFYREVRVKGYDSMLVRTLVAARTRLVQITTELSNQIRGLMKTFGLVVPRGKGGTFEAEVQRLLVGQAELARIILPMLEAWRSVRTRASVLGRQLLACARQSAACQQLMSIPGVGAITATSFTAAIPYLPTGRQKLLSLLWLFSPWQSRIFHGSGEQILGGWPLSLENRRLQCLRGDLWQLRFSPS